MVISHLDPGAPFPATTANALIDGVNAIALNGIIPTAVSTPAGSATVTANGAVSFSNASNVNVSGVFTGSFDVYRIVWRIPTQSAGADLEMRLMSAGTPDTSTGYNYLRGYDGLNTTSRTVGGATAATQWLLTAGAAAGQTNDGYMDLFGPALAAYTSGLAQAVVYNSTPNMYTTSTNLHHTASSSFDGFQMYPASGTITGTLRVYGYNNLT